MHETAYDARISDWGSVVCSSGRRPIGGCDRLGFAGDDEAEALGIVHACLDADVATFDNTRAGAVSATAYILVEIVEGQEFLVVGTRIPFGRNPPDVATAGYVDLVCARDLEIGRASCRERVCQYV